MKAILATAATATALMFGGAAHAQDSMCDNMLAVAIGNALESGGFDTTHACDLTLSELATIKAALEEEGMTGNTRQTIERILSSKG